MTQPARARSALWHARNKAYREWVEANRDLLEYLATSPDVPDHLRPAGALPPQFPREQTSVRTDALSRPDVEKATLGTEPIRTSRHAERIQNRPAAAVDVSRPDVRPAPRGDTGGSSYSRTRVNTPPGAPQPAGAADRVDRVIELVAAAGEQLVLTAADKRAIRSCTAEPTVIAEAIAAAARREWGDEWLRQNLSARLVIQRLSGYLASRKALPDQVDRRSPPMRRPPSEERAGPARTAYAFEGPWGPDRPPPISSADLERIAGETPS